MIEKHTKVYNEWKQQSAYDYETAVAMFNTGRFIYCIFMCHLAIEKLVKGIYVKKIKEYPPKTHNLIFITDKASIELDSESEDFLILINKESIPTRYPESLKKSLSKYNKEYTSKILKSTDTLLKWLNEIK